MACAHKKRPPLSCKFKLNQILQINLSDACSRTFIGWGAIMARSVHNVAHMLNVRIVDARWRMMHRRNTLAFVHPPKKHRFCMDFHTHTKCRSLLRASGVILKRMQAVARSSVIAWSAKRYTNGSKWWFLNLCEQMQNFYWRLCERLVGDIFPILFHTQQNGANTHVIPLLSFTRDPDSGAELSPPVRVNYELFVSACKICINTRHFFLCLWCVHKSVLAFHSLVRIVFALWSIVVGQ